MRLHKKNAILPRYIYSKYTDGNFSEEGKRELQKQLPYLNTETGLKNRMVLSDPLTGLGVLSDEWNPLAGNHITRKVSCQRDLIKLEGDRGQEYNCLYTTKELVCKPRDNRDPITLKGELGEELDPFRPHGGLPRNKMDYFPKRDPIVGTGEFGREWDPIHKYNGRSRSSYINKSPTDPITHSLPVTETSHNKKQYNECWSSRDPILHKNEESTSNHSNEMRHFPQRQRSFDPITNLPSPYATKEKRRPSGATKNGDAVNSVTSQLNNAPIHSGSWWPRPYTGRGPGVYSSQRIQRNPITGEGMKAEDYSDSATLSRQRSFRNRQIGFGHTQSPTRVQQVERAKTVTKAPQTPRTPETKKRLTERKQSSVPVQENQLEKSIEKKVVRPKRVSIEATTKAAENGVPTNDNLNGQPPAQSEVEHQFEASSQPTHQAEDMPHSTEQIVEMPLPAEPSVEEAQPEIQSNHVVDPISPGENGMHTGNGDSVSPQDEVFEPENSS